MSDGQATGILAGKGDEPEYLLLGLANRHGLVAGGAGTGKTVTLQVLAGRAQQAATAAAAPPAGGGLLSGLAGALGSVFGTSNPRGQRLSTGQAIAREVTRSVTNRVAGQIAADLGKSLGGKTGGTIGRAIIRGALGGMLRR